MQLIGLRQEPNILQGIDAAKPLDGTLTPLELTGLERVLSQALHLNPGIAADLLEKIQHESLLGFTELWVMETEQHGLHPGIAGILGFNPERNGSDSVEELTHMFECLDGRVVHDDVHPSS